MAGHFELFIDQRSQIRFRLLAPDGTFLAGSGPFDDKKAAAAAIVAVRECAGTGLIEDHSFTAAARAPEAAASSLEKYRNGRRASAQTSVAAGPSRPGGDPGRLKGFPEESEDLGEVLAGLAADGVSALSSTGLAVSCGLSVSRPKKTAAFGGSGAMVPVLHELQERLGEGPGSAAGTRQETVLVHDLARDSRWPRLAILAADRGVRSVLVVPVPVEAETRILLTVCGPHPDAFDYRGILAAEKFAVEASRVLRPALRIAELKDNLQNLHAALEHRTVIDTALGVVMAQKRCGHEAALEILVRAASTNNVKLRDVAAAVVASVSKERLPVHFDT